MNRLVLLLLKTELGRRLELQLLINLVSSSLSLPQEWVLLKGSEQGLSMFTDYTATHLPECTKAQKELLGQKALRLGLMLRNGLTDHSPEALMKVVVLLYRNIGIEMEGLFPNEVSVVRCHFCTRYDAPLCAIASVIDSGVICGLYAAATLCFTQRITQGNDKCLCHLKSKNSSPRARRFYAGCKSSPRARRFYAGVKQ